MSEVNMQMHYFAISQPMRRCYRALPVESNGFNGLPQVIVQSTREAGDIKLHTTSLRLASTDIRIGLR